LPVGPNYLEETGERSIVRTEGTATSHGFWNAVLDVLPKSHGLPNLMKGTHSCLIQSVAETVTEKSAAYEKYPPNERAIRIYMDRIFCCAFPAGDLKTLLRPTYYEDSMPTSEDSVLDAYRNAPVDDPLMKIDYIMATKFERHFIMSGKDLAGRHVNIIAPFTDNELVDFSFRTRPQIPIGNTNHAEMIVKHFPQVASIPKTAAGLPLSGSPLMNKARRGWMRFYHRILPTMTAGHFGGHDYSAYAHYNEWFRGGGRPYIERTLAQEDLFEDFLSPTAVRAVVANHMSGKTNDYSQICVLLTLALWRKTFW
jgi:hypothetical protein